MPCFRQYSQAFRKIGQNTNLGISWQIIAKCSDQIVVSFVVTTAKQTTEAANQIL